jgi:hypothetical protein
MTMSLRSTVVSAAGVSGDRVEGRWCGLWIIVAFALASCRPQGPELPAVTVGSGHFAYHTREGDLLFDGTLAAAEAHLKSTLSYLKLDWPAGERIDYYRAGHLAKPHEAKW